MSILPIEDKDIPEVVALETEVWREAAASAAHIRTRADTFREGSLVARLPDGRIGGYVVVQRVDHVSTGTWNQQTDHGRIAATHRPDGRLIYGVNLSVVPEGAKHGVSRALIAHCYETFVVNGACAAICLGSRLPGFARWARSNGRDVRNYLSSRESNLSRDPELRIYERNGFRLLWELDGYFDDPDSLNFGAMIMKR